LPLAYLSGKQAAKRRLWFGIGGQMQDNPLFSHQETRLVKQQIIVLQSGLKISVGLKIGWSEKKTSSEERSRLSVSRLIRFPIQNCAAGGEKKLVYPTGKQAAKRRFELESVLYGYPAKSDGMAGNARFTP
jgi:hypothetical protein